MEKINLNEKLDLFEDYWNPRIVGELNNQHVKLVKFKGEFVWHKHLEEDEMFFVVDGCFLMEFRDKTIEIKKNEFVIVPKGVEHRPIAKKEVSVMLFEPKTTKNTGDNSGKLTKNNLGSDNNIVRPPIEGAASPLPTPNFLVLHTCLSQWLFKGSTLH